MSSIKLHLEHAEFDAVRRYAESLGVSPEDVAYAALNRLMLLCSDREVNRDVGETREWRHNNLPLWSDSAGSVHAYEGKPDDAPQRSRFV
jgi:pyrroloquinoline quinone (PQQ) biosynthesis protein C